MRETFLPYARPAIGEEEIAEVVDTLRSGWLTTGPKVRKFEAEFIAAVGAPGALALSSGTAALHIAAAALGLKPGDEVITTPMTFCATANVIEHVGAKPVLVDVERDTLNIDPKRIEAAITPRTKAISVVHYAGHPVDLDAVNELARAHQLAVMEDAAHALPAKYKGRSIGQGQNLAAFSFYANKNLTTGEGGMLTGDPKLLERAKMLALHGMSAGAYNRYTKAGSWYYEVLEPGFKYNLTDIAASIGLWQLRKLERFQKRRREVVRAYREAFGALEALDLPVERPEIEHAWHLFAVRLKPGVLKLDRAQFIEELKARNIGTSVHFIPLHLHPFYRDRYRLTRDDLPIASAEFDRILSLPLDASMSDQDVVDVIEAVSDVVKKNRR